MTEEVQRMSQALEAALQMEIEGKEFYQRSGERSDNVLAKDLFLRLAVEEDAHIKAVDRIYKAVQSSAQWPQEETSFKHEKSLRSVFREAIEGMDRETKGSPSELEALKTAMSLEDKSYTFYKSRDEEAASEAEKSFYQALTAEERGHYLAVLDSYEYLTDPQAWFTKTEHWGLDAG